MSEGQFPYLHGFSPIEQARLKRQAEFLEQNLNLINLFAVEGMIWLDNEYFANMLDKKKSKTLKALQKLTQNDEYLLPFSPHMMIAVKK